MPRTLVLAIAIAASAGSLALAQSTLSPADQALVERVSWGRSPSTDAEVAQIGVEAWLQRQLHPQAGEHLPPDIQGQIAQMTIAKQGAPQLVRDASGANRFVSILPTPEQRQQAQQLYQQGLNELARQAAARSLLRDVYSDDQLKEQMTWFWLNHFNVHAAKANLRAMVGDYENAAIRPHALGHFRDLLEATLKHPAMLRYLDNADNAVGHINENYARELMELHTMGVGSGYTQADVQALAAILTGVGIDENGGDPKVSAVHAADLVHAGLFEFNPDRHDYGDKVLLGQPVKGAGFGEVEQALDILCRQPATARHVSTQIAEYFVSDNPPPALIDAMVATWARANGDIAAVLDTLFHSPAFRASLGQRFKDPAHYAVSAVRLAYDGREIVNPQPLQNWVNQLDEPLYGHETPDGYAMTADAWDAPGQMAARFEVARQIAGGAPALFQPPQPPPQPRAPLAQGAPPTPDAPRPPLTVAPSLEAHADDGPPLSPQTTAALSQATSPQEWDTLYLASPEFMRR